MFRCEKCGSFYSFIGASNICYLMNASGAACKGQIQSVFDVVIEKLKGRGFGSIELVYDDISPLGIVVSLVFEEYIDICYPPRGFNCILLNDQTILTRRFKHSPLLRSSILNAADDLLRWADPHITKIL